MENGLVSIVVPCYNQSHFLGEAIESIFRQTYKDYEVIVVNDGSTDKTSDVAESFQGVQLIEQDNMGLAASRNIGLQKSRGEYVVFLDADDRLLPDALEIGIKSLKDHPDCVFVSGVCDKITFEGDLLPNIQLKVEEKDYYLALLKFNYIWAPSNVMYRRAVFEKTAGFDSSVNPAADYEIYLRLARLFSVHHHGQTITEYRQHSSGMSKNYGLMLKNVLTVLYSQREFAKDTKLYKEAMKYGISWYKIYYLEAVCAEVYNLLKDYKLIKGIRSGIVLLYYPAILPKLFSKIIRNRSKRVAMA